MGSKTEVEGVGNSLPSLPLRQRAYSENSAGAMYSFHASAEEQCRPKAMLDLFLLGIRERTTEAPVAGIGGPW